MEIRKETLIFVAHTPGGQLPSRDMKHVQWRGTFKE